MITDIAPEGFIRVGYVGPQPPIDLNTIPKDATLTFEGTSVPNRLTISFLAIRDEERKNFKNFRDFISYAFSTIEIETSETLINIHISRHANLIAARTRRGAGNKIIVGPDSIVPSIFGFETSLNPALEPNEALVLYSGRGEKAIDAGAIWHEDKHGRINAIVMQNSTDHLGNSKDYGILIKFKVS